MIRREKKNLVLKILYDQRFLALVGLAIIILISFPLAKNISRRYKLNKEIQGLGKEISDLETRNKDLKQLISYLESDQFVEEKARLDLGLKKEGESVVVIQENPADASKASNEENAKKENLTNFDKWWNYFFK